MIKKHIYVVFLEAFYILQYYLCKTNLHKFPEFDIFIIEKFVWNIILFVYPKVKLNPLLNQVTCIICLMIIFIMAFIRLRYYLIIKLKWFHVNAIHRAEYKVESTDYF